MSKLYALHNLTALDSDVAFGGGGGGSSSSGGDSSSQSSTVHDVAQNLVCGAAGAGTAIAVTGGVKAVTGNPVVAGLSGFAAGQEVSRQCNESEGVSNATSGDISIPSSQSPGQRDYQLATQH